MINFGIDLGTTNSAIAKFDKGQVMIFRNPIGQKDTLPSVVAFRKDRIIVGEKAREYLSKAPKRVVGSFKRKMGTDETYTVEGQEQALSPAELSAYVLKELKNFIHTGEALQAAVITIPASFDTVQSNATRKAGELAGLEQVKLLQEPIAASLAYANQDEADKFEEGQWLVYDLGGGTFDVALIRIQNGEMQVLDHEGDNFLGGTDFDQAIVEKLVIPHLEEEGTFANLRDEMRSASGKYNALYQKLLLLAEEAKVQLSTQPLAEIEFETEDDEGKELEIVLSIKREEFEALLAGFVEKTIEMIRQILQRNQLSPDDLKFILMVGGSTYIPYVREQVGEQLSISVNTRVDPTTAVAVGAAFYAGTQPLKKPAKKEEGPISIPINDTQFQGIQVKVAYQKATQEMSEYFTAKFTGETEGLFYRIIRGDGGFDSGLKLLQEQIEEDLPLVKDSFNTFTLKVLDEQNNSLPLDAPAIGISQGRYSVVGQPLPNDICLEIDDVENLTTVLEVVFEKNTILPVRKTLTKQITRTIAKGSSDHLTISVVEGPGTALPAANQTIGFIRISGEELERDLIAGSDVEITLEVSESRDLSIQAYLMMTDQEYENAFSPSERAVNVPRLAEELYALADKIRKEIEEAELQDNYETAQKLVDLEYEILDIADQCKKLKADDVTDTKYQLEDQKRKIARKVDEITRDKYLNRVKQEYFKAKREMEDVLEYYTPKDEDEVLYHKMMDEEKNTLATNSTLKIQELINRMRRLGFRIKWNNTNFIRNFYMQLRNGWYGTFTSPAKARQYVEQGDQAMESGNDGRLRQAINGLINLLPPTAREQIGNGGTGIG
ncbi:MAG: Hsp70 family protein [Bacteroidota bacterium]